MATWKFKFSWFSYITSLSGYQTQCVPIYTVSECNVNCDVTFQKLLKSSKSAKCVPEFIIRMNLRFGQMDFNETWTWIGECSYCTLQIRIWNEKQYNHVMFIISNWSLWATIYTGMFLLQTEQAVTAFSSVSHSILKQARYKIRKKM